MKTLHLIRLMLPLLTALCLSVIAAVVLIVSKVVLPPQAFIVFGAPIGALAGMMHGARPDTGLKLQGLPLRLGLGLLLGVGLGLIMVSDEVAMAGMLWFPTCLALGTYIGIWLQLKQVQKLLQARQAAEAAQSPPADTPST